MLIKSSCRGSRFDALDVCVFLGSMCAELEARNGIMEGRQATGGLVPLLCSACTSLHGTKDLVQFVVQSFRMLRDTGESEDPQNQVVRREKEHRGCEASSGRDCSVERNRDGVGVITMPGLRLSRRLV